MANFAQKPEYFGIRKAFNRAVEVADHILPATNQLFKRYPDAQPLVIR